MGAGDGNKRTLTTNSIPELLEEGPGMPDFLCDKSGKESTAQVGSLRVTVLGFNQQV